ncbi:MAG: hypothetical protein AAF754_01200 [Pseudomonadota bacterium]
MKPFFLPIWATCLSLVTLPASAFTFTAFDDQTVFESWLTDSFSLVDFDDATFNTPLVAGDPRLTSRGLNVLAADSRGFFETVPTVYPANPDPGPTINAHYNGSGTSTVADDFAVNFTNGVNGFGFAGNIGSSGAIEFYTQENLAGGLFGSVAILSDGSFTGGIIEGGTFRSARITCGDLSNHTCGLTDLQFGTIATSTTSPVPVPPGFPLLAGGLALSFCVARRTRSK